MKNRVMDDNDLEQLVEAVVEALEIGGIAIGYD
jgi:hypothetical protein